MGGPVQVDSTSPRDQAAIEALFAAINAGDKAAFLATLHPDIVYSFNHQGFSPARGKDAVGQVWDAMTSSFADLHEDIVTLYVRPDHAVAHWRMQGRLAGPWPLGTRLVQPRGVQPAFTLPGVDIFTLKDGLILAKDTWADVGIWFEAWGHLAEHV